MCKFFCVFQSAVGHEYQSKLSKHCSQVDSVKGFGGKFGVQVDRVDQVSIFVFLELSSIVSFWIYFKQLTRRLLKILTTVLKNDFSSLSL